MDPIKSEKLKVIKEKMKPFEEELRAARQSGDKDRLKAAHVALQPYIEESIKVLKETQ